MSAIRLLPGLALLCVGALVARVISPVVGVNHLLMAVVFGFVLSNAVGLPEPFERGVSTHKLWLTAGIVLMGASITLDTVLEAGGIVLVVILGVTGFTLLSVELLSRSVFGLTDRLGSLLAAGASICGVSAVVAVAGAIRAHQTQIAYAAGTVLLFDAVTLAVYPFLGDLLGLSGKVFGIWAGVSMFSTGPVVAVGFAHSEIAGQWATISKLVRNTLIGVVAVVYASYYVKTDVEATGSLQTLWDEFPKFILGFIAVALIASTGALSAAHLTSIENAYNWLFLVAFVGLGTEIKLGQLRQTGFTPTLVVLITLVATSVLSLMLLQLLFG